MTANASALYGGTLSHQRFTPRPHRLRYAMFQLLLDLDEAPALGRRLRLFSCNRFNLFSHHDRDHGEGRPGALRSWVEDLLGEAGMPIKGGRILLLCMPRLLGHVFNPLSIYYCHRPDGSLAAMLYEVNNTFGQRHCYLIAAETGEDGSIRQSCPKAFYVSPFMDMAMTYEFTLTEPRDRIQTGVMVRDAHGEAVFVANFTGARRDIDDAALLLTAIRYPLLTLKVVAAIRLEAVKLWLKGLRWGSPPPPPTEPVTVVES